MVVTTATCVAEKTNHVRLRCVRAIDLLLSEGHGQGRSRAGGRQSVGRIALQDIGVKPYAVGQVENIRLHDGTAIVPMADLKRGIDDRETRRALFATKAIADAEFGEKILRVRRIRFQFIAKLPHVNSEIVAFFYVQRSPDFL